MSLTPQEFPELFSSIVIGTGPSRVVSPGTVTLSGHDRIEKWKTTEADGQTGATSQHQGLNIGEFQASFYLASPDEQMAWPAFQSAVVALTAGPRPRAVPIYHPDLALNRLTEVSGAGVLGAVRDGQGGVTIAVRFIEYRPPRPRPTSSASGASSATTAPGEAPDPNAAAKRELAELLDQASQL